MANADTPRCQSFLIDDVAHDVGRQYTSLKHRPCNVSAARQFGGAVAAGFPFS